MYIGPSVQKVPSLQCHLELGIKYNVEINLQVNGCGHVDVCNYNSKYQLVLIVNLPKP